MEIRNPNKSHLPELHALLQRCFGGFFSPQAVADRIFYEEAYDPNHVWMAREAGQMLGFLHTVLDGDKAYIKLLAVAPERRRSGLGRDLLSRAEYRLSGEGAKSAWVTATPPRDFFPGLSDGSVAEAFFIAQGYQLAGRATVHWIQPGSGAPTPQPDLEAAIFFAREHAPEQWSWVEECLACRPSQAVYLPGSGLILAQPGESLGPLWPAPGAKPEDVQTLAQTGLALASQQPCRDIRGLRWQQLNGSAPTPLSSAAHEDFLSYTKSLR